MVESSLAQDSSKAAGRELGGPHREQDQQSGHEDLYMVKMSLVPCTGLYVSFLDVAALVSRGPRLRSPRFPLLKDLTLHLKEGYSAEIRE